MAHYLLGIDNGGTVSKVVLLDLNGHEVASASRKDEALYPRPHWVERDMEGIWQATAAAIREVLAVSGIAAQEIVAIGGTGHGNGLYLVDKAGQPLRNGILSIDSRALALAQTLNADGTSQRAWVQNVQQLWPGLTAVVLRWIRDNEPDVYQRIGSALLIKDYIKLRLTGVVASDTSDMSGSGLLDLWQRGYSSALLDTLGLPDAASLLPALYESTEIVGKVTSQAAAETGLLEGTPVAAGIFDVSANALAAGVVDVGQVCISAGTWSINEIVTPTPVDDKRLFQNSLYLTDRCMLIEASPTSASNLEWFVTQFYPDKRTEADALGVSVFELCNSEVASLAPEGTSVLFHPFLYGSNLHSTARAGFYGMAGWHTRAHLLRAVYEGVVYGHLSHVETLGAAGLTMSVARLTGGGSRSDVWAQMFADVLQLPIEVTRSREMGARGAALVAGIGAGVYADYHDAVAKTVVVERRYEPDPAMFSYYRARYAEYRFIAEAMRDAWTRLSTL
jgi:L-xylulokinase